MEMPPSDSRVAATNLAGTVTDDLFLLAANASFTL
jgi:hypothetical protein